MSLEQYVSSREGEKMLGVDTGRFFYYVKSGQITKEPGSKKRGARYRVADILMVKEKLAERQHKSKTSIHGVVDWIVGVNDVLSSLKLDYLVYQEDVSLKPLDYYVERVKRNPHVALAIYDSPQRERILAYISLLPLPETLILDVLRGDRQETDIRADEVETYERQGEYTLLAESIVTYPDHPELLHTLLTHLMDYWCQQYPERFIRKIYAQAASQKGDILIQKLYFAPCYHLSRNAFVLDLERPGASRFVRHFQECLKSKG